MRLQVALALTMIGASPWSITCAEEKEKAKSPIRIYQINPDGTKTPLDADRVVVETLGRQETVRELLAKLHEVHLHSIDVTLRDAETKETLPKFEMKSPPLTVPVGGYDTVFPRLVRQSVRGEGQIGLMWVGEGALRITFSADGYVSKEVALTKDEARKGSLDVFLKKEK